MKKIINDKIISRWLLHTFIILIPLSGFSQPDIPIDAVLKNNSESWKVKFKQKFINNKPAAINFGPVKTIETGVEKAQQLSRDVSRDIFWKNIKTIESRESHMMLTYNDTDTISVNILTVSTEEVHKRNVTGVIFNKDKDEESSYTSPPLVDEMVIEFRDDPAKWRFAKTDSATFSSTGCTGKLQSVNDSFFIRPIDNYTGKKLKAIMFSQPASGFIFLHDGKQIAAFQLMVNKTVWISKELNKSEERVIVAAIAGLFATIKPEYMGSF